mgnify:CR=1 FL=1
MAHNGNISTVLSLFPVILSIKLKMDSIIHSKKFCMRDGINFLDFKPQKKAVKIKTATIVAITYVLVTPKKFSPIKPNACIYIYFIVIKTEIVKFSLTLLFYSGKTIIDIWRIVMEPKELEKLTNKELIIERNRHKMGEKAYINACAEILKRNDPELMEAFLGEELILF